MDKKIIYKFKEDADFNKLAELDWDIIPSENDLIFFKIVPQPVNGDLYCHLLNNFYRNEEWKKRVYSKFKNQITKDIGVKYDKNGILKMNPKLETTLTMWRLETNKNDDFWLGLKSYDPNDRHYFYSQEVLNKYCKEEIEKLKELDLIEEFNVD